MGKHDYDYLISIPGVCAIASKSAYAQGRQSIRQDSEIANPKEKFFQVIKALVESVFTDGIRSIPSFSVTDDGVMSGTFKEAQPRGQLYKFVITKQGKVKYNETDIERRDSVSSFPYWTFRVDTRSQPQCSKGKRCKGACIEKGRVCEVPLPIQIRRELPQIQKAAIAGKSGNWKLAAIAIAALPVAHFVIGVSSAIDRLNKQEAVEVEKAIAKQEAIAKQKQTISSSKLEKILQKEESKIKDAPRENLKIINPKDGSIVLDIASEKQTEVNLSLPQTKLVKGCVVTHNHPRIAGELPNAKGVSFSGADIQAACYYEAAEIRAVSAGYRHSLKPPQNGWDQKYFDKTLKPVYQKHKQNQLYLLSYEVRIGRISAEQANEDFAHRTVQAMSNELGLDYKREPIRV